MNKKMNKNWKVVRKSGQGYYRIRLLGLTRDLPLFEVEPGIKIAIFNTLGDTQLIKKVSSALIKKFPKTDFIATAEAKSIPLAYEISRQLKIPFIILRKSRKPYMTGSLKTQVESITTQKVQELWLDGKDRKILKNKRVILVDDIISTGATLKGMRRLIKRAGGKIVAESAVLTEGEIKKWKNIISLGNLPIFINKTNKNG